MNARRAPTWTWVLALSLSTSPALAAPERWRLDYQQGGQTDCPDEAAFVRLVAERLGEVPFEPEAPRRVAVRFSAGKTGPAVDLAVTPGPGAVPGLRHLEASAPGCGELAKSAALSVALVIDPLVLTRPPPAALPPPPKDEVPEVKAPAPRVVVTPRPPPPPVEVPPVSVTPPPPPPRLVPPRQPPFEVRHPETFAFAVALNLSILEVPGTTTAWALEAMWETNRTALGVRFEATNSGEAPYLNGSVTGSQLSVGPQACMQTTGPLGLCVLARGGIQMNGSRGLAHPQYGSTPIVAVGARPYLQLDAGHWRLRLQAGVQAQPLITILTVGGQEAWRSSIFSFWGGLAVGFGADPARVR